MTDLRVQMTPEQAQVLFAAGSIVLAQIQYSESPNVGLLRDVLLSLRWGLLASGVTVPSVPPEPMLGS